MAMLASKRCWWCGQLYREVDTEKPSGDGWIWDSDSSVLCEDNAACVSRGADRWPARRAAQDAAVTVHRLKTWIPYFQDVVDGVKPFEIRRNDRGFQVGDRLRLIEIHPPFAGLPPTGREAEAEVTYVLPGGQFGIEPGYVVLGLGSARITGDPLTDRAGNVRAGECGNTERAAPGGAARRKRLVSGGGSGI